MLKIAILDDYAGVALASAEWGVLKGLAEITVFRHHLAQEDALIALAPFDVLCTVRERMALPRLIFEALPNLKAVLIVGRELPNLDLAAATDAGVIVVHSEVEGTKLGQITNATPELTWGLLIATVRHFAIETRALREGRWQSTVGHILAGRTLGLLGLGRIGKRVAEYGRAFGMELIAWSQNLTEEAASGVGVKYVTKEQLFVQADVVSIHLRLADRTRGLVTARELALMKPRAYLINTSRGPIVEEAALIEALRSGQLAGAGLDVFDEEPLPPDHPLRSMDNVTVLPHLGYVTEETLRSFYGDMPQAIAAYIQGTPVRVTNEAALIHAKHARPA